MSNSSLVNHTKLSPNHYNGRNHSIDTITIHCVVGQCSVETIGSIFANASREASSNYGIGYDGKIGLYVDEKNKLTDHQKIRLLKEGEIEKGENLFAVDIYE